MVKLFWQIVTLNGFMEGPNLESNDYACRLGRGNADVQGHQGQNCLWKVRDAS